MLLKLFISDWFLDVYYGSFKNCRNLITAITLIKTTFYCTDKPKSKNYYISINSHIKEFLRLENSNPSQNL